MISTVILVAVYVLFAPLIGGLLAGADRILTARMQSRTGPPLLQPFSDVRKLLAKRELVVNRHQGYYVWFFLVFTVLTGCIFFAGGDLLLTVFAFTVAGVCLAVGAFSTNSPYSHLGASRELLQIMACEPMLILVVLGLYLATGSFNVYEIASSPVRNVILLPGIFLGLLWILTIKLRKSPFDLSTSHHGHQELVKGVTTEFAGPQLALIEIAHWYENVFLLGLIYLFFSFNPWIGVAAVVVGYFAEVLVDNSYARLTWQAMVRSTWTATLLLGVVNLVALHAAKQAGWIGG